jgi:hypothetical protein
VVTPLSTSEPTILVIVGAPFGDLEFDVGKSVRWSQFFGDKLFILDINVGEPRYWIVNWALTFPQSENAMTSINFFNDPVGFRKDQWAKAQTAFPTIDDAAWVLWVDGSEAISFDNASLPNDYAIAPFRSFVWREVQRAIAAGHDYAVLPFFAFLRSSEIQNVTYPQAQTDPNVPSVLQAISVPYYQAAQGLKRLTQVSALRNPAFDWSSLDTLATPDINAKAQIVSYAYAHWNINDIPPGETEVPALSAANDDGWRMCQKISKVRPIPGIPGTGAWNPNDQPVGLPGPWAVATLTNTHPGFVPTTDTPPTASAAATAGIKTPLYDCAFRLNMRDGVWYEGGVSGNTPMVWDSENQKWTTPYDPTYWPDYGVKAGDNPDYVDPPTPT